MNFLLTSKLLDLAYWPLQSGQINLRRESMIHKTHSCCQTRSMLLENRVIQLGTHVSTLFQ